MFARPTLARIAALFLAAAIPVVAFVPSSAHAQAATSEQNVMSSSQIREVFNRLSSSERKMIQSEAAVVGMYTSAIDGKFGRGTETAIRALPKWIREMSSGKVIVKADTPTDLERFLREVARKEWSSWIYGEGGEGE